MLKRRIFSIFAALILIGIGLPLPALAGEATPADETARFFLIYDGPAAPAAIDALDYRGESDFAKAASRVGAVTLSPWVGEPDGIGLGDEIILNLFPDAYYLATVDRLSMDVNDVVSVRGRLLDYPHGYAIMSTYEGRTIASIVVPEEGLHYVLFHEPESNEHYLAELDPDLMDRLEEAPPLLSPSSDWEEEGDVVVLQDYTTTDSGVEDPATIDVMVVYTGAAENWAATRGGIESIIAQAMETAQLVMDNSDTGVTMQLVHSASVTYTEADSAATDLTRLTNTGDGYMDEVHDWRDEYGADLVSLFAYVSNYGGVAWLLSSTAGQPAYGFSITRVQQAATGYTHIHEMGHNMGAHHHKEQNVQPGPGLFSYSAGWRWAASGNNRWCTVMTYENGTYFDDGQTHRRLPYFSNPHVSHQGDPTGDASDGDNARTIREVKHVIAAYRSTQLAPPWLTTEPATDLDVDSAILHGVLDDLGDYHSVEVSFEWWTDPADKSETASQAMSTPGLLNIELDGLEPETVYYFRAKGVADGVTVYGDVLSFTTLPAEPGPAVAVTISPQEASIIAGESQAYTATARDEFGNEFDVTAETVFAVEEAAGGTWEGSVYTSETAGAWTVTAVYGALTDTATLTVEPGETVEPLEIVTATLPAGMVGVVYEATLETTGGTEPYTWAIINGVLPDEVGLDAASGVISGTPTAAGTFEFTVQVTDDTGETATADLSITISQSEQVEFVYELKDGWNMISLPLYTEVTGLGELFPDAVVYAWDPVALSYFVPAELVPGQGYWVLSFGNTSVTIQGVPVEEYELTDAVAGGHLIGSLSVDARVTATAGSIYNLFYWWNPHTLSYEATETLQPGKGYWLSGLTDFSIKVEPRPPED